MQMISGKADACIGFISVSHHFGKHVGYSMPYLFAETAWISRIPVPITSYNQIIGTKLNATCYIILYNT